MCRARVPFFVNGAKESFNDAYDITATTSDLLADVGEFNTAVRNSTFPTFRQVDIGQIDFDNNSVDGASNAVNSYRQAADDLLNRVEAIPFTDNAAGANARRQLQYAANFHGGISRYFLATYFSEDGVNGGAPISTAPPGTEPGDIPPSEFIPSAELYNQALTKLETALGFISSGATGQYETRVINTIRARIALFQGNREQAGTFAAAGLVSGDDPYSGRYASTSTNEWYSNGGIGSGADLDQPTVRGLRRARQQEPRRRCA